MLRGWNGFSSPIIERYFLQMLHFSRLGAEKRASAASCTLQCRLHDYIAFFDGMVFGITASARELICLLLGFHKQRRAVYF
jgi:hypothetical protein